MVHIHKSLQGWCLCVQGDFSHVSSFVFGLYSQTLNA